MSPPPLQEQDQQLDEIETHLKRVGHMGLVISEEMESQNHLLTDLDDEVDTVGSRLRATQKKIKDIINKSGSTKQLVIIVILVIILIILAVFALG